MIVRLVHFVRVFLLSSFHLLSWPFFSLSLFYDSRNPDPGMHAFTSGATGGKHRASPSRVVIFNPLSTATAVPFRGQIAYQVGIS